MIDNNRYLLQYGHFNEDGIYIHNSFDNNVPCIVHAIRGVTIGDLGSCNIGVIDTERDIPRFHVFTENDIDIAIRIDKPEYYSTKMLFSIKEKEDLNSIMNMKSILNCMTVWEDICSLWNDYNDIDEVNYTQPDYRLL